MSQFSQVGSIYGAPMGRSEDRIPADLPARSVRLYRVKLNRGGYDDGGAYWGTGQPLYCAEWTIGEEDGRRFVRADNRFYAARKLGIPDAALIMKAVDPNQENIDGAMNRLTWYR